MAVAQAGEVQPGAGLRNILSPESLDFQPREIHIGGQWGRVYAVLDFPPAVGPAWLARAASTEGVTMALHAVPTDPTNVVLAPPDSQGRGAVAAFHPDRSHAAPEPVRSQAWNKLSATDRLRISRRTDATARRAVRAWQQERQAQEADREP